MRNGDTIIHVELPDMFLDKHYYFGSVTAIYDVLGRQQIGVGKETVCRHLKKDSKYITPTGVVVRKSQIHRKTRKQNQ